MLLSVGGFFARANNHLAPRVQKCNNFCDFGLRNPFMKIGVPRFSAWAAMIFCISEDSESFCIPGQVSLRCVGSHWGTGACFPVGHGLMPKGEGPTTKKKEKQRVLLPNEKTIGERSL